MEWVRSHWQPSHSICRPGSFTAKIQDYVSDLRENSFFGCGQASAIRKDDFGPACVLTLNFLRLMLSLAVSNRHLALRDGLETMLSIPRYGWPKEQDEVRERERPQPAGARIPLWFYLESNYNVLQVTRVFVTKAQGMLWDASVDVGRSASRGCSVVNRISLTNGVRRTALELQIPRRMLGRGSVVVVRNDEESVCDCLLPRVAAGNALRHALTDAHYGNWHVQA